jgi:hypothetical protein
MTKRVRRVEKDPPWGWVARRKEGTEIGPGGEQGFRWRTRDVARSVVIEDDHFIEVNKKAQARAKRTPRL